MAGAGVLWREIWGSLAGDLGFSGALGVFLDFPKFCSPLMSFLPCFFDSCGSCLGVFRQKQKNCTPFSLKKGVQKSLKGNRFFKNARKRPTALLHTSLSAAALQGLREGEGVLEFRDGIGAQEAFLRLGAEGVVWGQDAVL